MKRYAFLSFILMIGTIFMISYYQGQAGRGPEVKNGTFFVLQDKSLTPEMKAMLANGEKIYKAKCIVCHQPDGKGLPGAFPPLAGSDYLLKDKVRAVAQTLNGSNMEITVNGQKYVAPMPPQVDTKEDAVAVINYVLNNFGNKGGYVTMEAVKDVMINPRK
jgi:mono/diheme cytochrome c family protein